MSEAGVEGGWREKTLSHEAQRLGRIGKLGPAIAALVAGLLGGCAHPGLGAGAQDRFFERLHAHCGKAFEGRLVSSDSADAAMAGQKMVMHVAQCGRDRVRIPFHVGSDRSRTWVITRTAAGLRLKHDHRHEDGSPDELTDYGGDSAGPGTASRQEFPADAQSIALFRRTGREVSVTNVWAVEVNGTRFAYELRRPPGANARFFQVEFDLTRSVPPPPLPWGWQP